MAIRIKPPSGEPLNAGMVLDREIGREKQIAVKLSGVYLSSKHLRRNFHCLLDRRVIRLCPLTHAQIVRPIGLLTPLTILRESQRTLAIQSSICQHLQTLQWPESYCDIDLELIG